MINKQNNNEVNNSEESNSVNQQILKISDFILQNKIGAGSFGKVYKVTEKQTGQALAAKISFSSFDDIKENEAKNIFREVNIISKLNHPSVLKFYGYSPINFKKKPKPIIITEFAANGSLDDLIQSARSSNITINDTIKLIIIYGIASAMFYLHSNEILHRDLKPANILLNEYLFPKIADFGLSKMNDKTSMASSVNGFKGTPIYMSPEIWKNSEYSAASDVYAFAIILFELMTYEKPFEHFYFWDIPLKIQDGYRPEFKKEIPESYRNLIVKCWANDAVKRPSFNDILIQLKSDRGFITDNVNEKDFLNYIRYIDDYKVTFNSENNNFSFDQLFSYKESTINRIDLTRKGEKIPAKINETISNLTVIPFKFNVQLKNCRKFINELDDSTEKKLNFAKLVIEGQYYFFQNVEIGINDLSKLVKKEDTESILYYCNLLIKGKIIPKDHSKVKKLLKILKLKKDEENYSLIYGKLLLNENEYAEAKEQFKKSIEYDNDEAMYQYGKMLLKGLGAPINEEEAIEYYLRSIEKGNEKAMYKYGLYLIEQKQEETKGIQFIKNSVNKGYSKAFYYYYNIIKDSDEEESMKYLKEAALKGHTEAMYQYGLKLQNYKENIESLEESFLFLNKASSKCHIDAIYQYGLLLSTQNKVRYNLEESARNIRIAANLGHTEAIVKYGLMLLFGEGVNIDKEEAIKYFKIAADKGNIDALNFYSAQLMQLDNKTPEMIQESLKYFKMAADQGHSLALNNYGTMLAKGIGITQNKEEAIKYYKMAIEKDCALAMVSYADLLSSDDEKYQNKEEAIKYYKMAIEKDCTKALVSYADLLSKDNGKYQNKEEAIKYYKMAIEKGNEEAMNNYALMLWKENGIPVDTKEAIRLFKMAIEKDYSPSMVNYGLMLSNGIGTQVNKNEATKLFKMAADKNHVKGYVNYGIMLIAGHGVEMNIEEGVKYFKMAIDEGDDEAMNNYGHMLLHGSGIPSNKEEAVKYFKMAIEKGNTNAMNNYADMLFKGDGVPQDAEEAFKYYKMGCDKGCSDSMFFYGANLLTYYGMEKKEESFKYIKMAADLGNEEALNLYNILGIQQEIKQRRRTKDIEININVSLEQLYSGIIKQFAIGRKVVCAKCKGTGTKNGMIPNRCEMCGGRGAIYITLHNEDDNEDHQVLAECFSCNGKKELIDDDNICDECKREQIFEKDEIVTLDIKEGSKDGDRIVFEGLSDEFYDFDTGDMIFIIKEQKHKIFKRNQNDLYILNEINLLDALYGTRFAIEHLDGRKLIIETNPNEIIEPDAVQKIVGEGMPIKGESSKKGDLYIHYKINFPSHEQLTEEFKTEIFKISPINDKIENIDLNSEKVTVVNPITLTFDESDEEEEEEQ